MIGYARRLLIVHERLPGISGYTRANTRGIDNTPAAEVTLQEDDERFAAFTAAAS